MSETEKLENPRFYRKQERKLKTLHRQLSRKMPGSRNRAQARLKLARYYDKIGNARTDWLHKQSTTLAREHEAIILEDVNLEGMKRFHKGFAKTVTLDFSWGAFTWMLRYKMEWFGKHLVMVDRFFPSSKTCSQCGYLSRIEISRENVDVSGVRHPARTGRECCEKSQKGGNAPPAGRA